MVSDLGTQDRARQEELARAIEERDAQRAAAKQKALEVKLLNAVLRQKDEALRHPLTEKVALTEGHGEAILRAETALQAVQAEIDQGRKRVEGTYEDLV